MTNGGFTKIFVVGRREREMIMKGRIIKICVMIPALLIAVKVAVTVVVIAFGYLFIVISSLIPYEKNYKPDDNISEAIYEAVGDEKVRYCGKKYINPGKMGVSGEFAIYTYQIRDPEDEDLLTDMVEAANAVIKGKKVAQKMKVVIEEEFVSGAYRTAVSVRNYYEEEDGYRQYDFFQNLYIGQTIFDSYNKAETYINLPDIKRLCVSKEIARDAEEEGIDWYEIWPDLEYYEVLED